MLSTPYHIDVANAQQAHHSFRCCGDVFLSKRDGNKGRMVAILSDGLGSGAIANVLATLTSSMALKFTLTKQDPDRTARIIMDTLPIDAHKRVSYATFVIVDIESDGETRMVEFDNPPVLLFRQGELAPVPRQVKKVETKAAGDRQMNVSRFFLKEGDRLIMVSDGVTHSGMGRDATPFGYGIERVGSLVKKLIQNDPDISSRQLSRAVVQRAIVNDVLKAQDDITCGVIHLRSPRKLIVCSGPPFTPEHDGEMATAIRDFPGKKIICGGTTSQIIAQKLGVELEVILGEETEGLPPRSRFPGIDLVTEGVVTLSRVESILRDIKTGGKWQGQGPAWEIVRMMLNSDSIHFLVGTRVNIAHFDPKLPVELEARRTLLRRIANLLENKFGKATSIQLI